MRAVTTRNSVSFINVWRQLNAAGEVPEPDRARKSMTTLLSQLNWWVIALRDARNATPYAKAVA